MALESELRVDLRDGIIGRMATRTPGPVTIGRTTELAEIAARLEHARDGSPSVVLISGEAGIGKTHLLQRAAERARGAGMSVLTGSSAPYAYAPLISILRELRRHLGDPRLQRMLTGARGSLAKLVPGLEPGRDPTPAEVVAQAPLFEGVLDLISMLGRDEPLLIGIEDLHRADESTLDLVAFLATNLTTERAVLVVTARTGQAGHGRLAGFLSELVRQPNVQRLELSPLSDAEVAQLLAALQDHRPAEEVAVRIARRSEGNPFYLEELLAAGPGEADLPHGLEELLIARLAGLSPETRQVLRAASVLGDRPHARLLRAITDLPDETFRAGLEEASDHGLLLPEGGLSERYLFRHDLIREVVHRRLLVDERQRLHTTAAQQLEVHPELAAGGEQLVHAELGRHWHLAGEPDRAFSASVAASEEARRVHALSEALAHLERAMGIWDRISDGTRTTHGPRYALERRCAELAVLLADPQAGVAHLDAALAAPEDVPDATRALLHMLRASFLRHGLAEPREAERSIERALGMLPSGPSPERAEVLARVAGDHFLAGRPERGVPYASEAVDLAREVGARAVEAMALSYHGCGLQALGREEEGVQRVREGLSLALEVEDAEEIKRGYINLSAMLRRSGRFAEAVEVAREAVVWATDRGIGATNVEWLTLIEMSSLVQAGRWEEAERALPALRSVSRRMVTADVLEAVTVASLRVGQGRFDEARDVLGRVPRELRDELDPQMRAPLLEVEAALAVAEDRHDDARDAVGRAAGAGERILAREGKATYEAGIFLDPALAHGVRAEADRAVRARERGEDAVIEDARTQALGYLRTLRQAVEGAIDGTFTHTRLRASLTAAQAELTRLEGGSDPGAWRRAVEAAVPTGMPHREAYARLRLGEALLGSGERDAAAEELGEAGRIAERVGAEPLRQEIAGLARHGRLGLELAHRGGELRGDLTRRETDVLELLVKGRTNRQIGEGLYISEKTVERHVTSILSKLQVDNRTEAAAVARERQLVT